MSKPVESQIPLKKALLWILLSTVLISGSALALVVYTSHIQRQRLSESQFNIVAIVQTTPDKERLKNFYLAELLNLSIDKPTNLFALSVHEAKNALLASSVISSASVKKIKPGTIFIDYSLRKPMAHLLDYENTLVDGEGVPFPFKPFFTPKIIPEIYLGLMDEPFTWGEPIKGIKIKLALYLIQLLSQSCCGKNFQLKRVDVSHVLADSNGQRQIIVTIEDRQEQGRSRQQILRLSMNNYRQELANYLVLRDKILKSYSQQDESVILDLRIPELAYMTRY
jgi:hypothetical protein